MKLIVFMFSLYLFSNPDLKMFNDAELKEFYCDEQNKISEFGIPCGVSMNIKFTKVETIGIFNNYYIITGNILSDDSFGHSISEVIINLGQKKNGFCYSEYLTETDSLGNFEIRIPAKRNRFLEFKQIGFSTLMMEIPN